MTLSGLRLPSRRLGDRWHVRKQPGGNMQTYQWVRVVSNDWEYTERVGGFAA